MKSLCVCFLALRQVELRAVPPGSLVGASLHNLHRVRFDSSAFPRTRREARETFPGKSGHISGKREAGKVELLSLLETGPTVLLVCVTMRLNFNASLEFRRILNILDFRTELFCFVRPIL